MAQAVETAAMWLSAHCTSDDAKLLAPLFEAQGVSSAVDVLALTKEDLVELKVAIGPRNRFIEAQAKAKGGAAAEPAPAPAKPGPQAPQAPPAAPPGQWSCPACTANNANAHAHCELCGTSNPNKPIAPPAPVRPPAPHRPPRVTPTGPVARAPGRGGGLLKTARGRGIAPPQPVLLDGGAGIPRARAAMARGGTPEKHGAAGADPNIVMPLGSSIDGADDDDDDLSRYAVPHGAQPEGETDDGNGQPPAAVATAS